MAKTKAVKIHKTANCIMIETLGSGRVCVSFCDTEPDLRLGKRIQLSVLGGETTLRIAEAKALMQALTEVTARPEFSGKAKEGRA